MAANTLPASAARTGRWQANWIISRRDDLTWFIGSALISYVVLGLMKSGFPIAPLYLIWFFGIDGPHVWATITRTYFDREARQKLGWWLWIVIPFMLIGLAAAGAGFASWYFLFGVCWQHFHISKQHYGFIMLWKAKNGERGGFDRRLDRIFLMATLVVPLAHFVVRTRPQIAALPLVEQTAAEAIPAYLLLLAAYLARQVWKWRQGLELNTPKLMLLAVLVPLQWLAFLHAAEFGPDGILRAGITLGMFHSFQYHRLMWFHNQNRYGAADGESRFGFAAVLARKCQYYVAAAVGVHFLVNFVPIFVAPPSEWLPSMMWGVAFTHYVLDARIWRVRGDRELAEALHL
jgi:hypothetical protein